MAKLVALFKLLFLYVYQWHPNSKITKSYNISKRGKFYYGVLKILSFSRGVILKILLYYAKQKYKNGRSHQTRVKFTIFSDLNTHLKDGSLKKSIIPIGWFCISVGIIFLFSVQHWNYANSIMFTWPLYGIVATVYLWHVFSA